MEPGMHTFDTHKYIKAFKNSGFNEAQAEAIVNTIIESKDFDLSRLASKEQLIAVDKDIHFIKQEIANIKQEMGKFATKEQLTNVEKDIFSIKQEMAKFATKEELKAEIAILQANLLKWMIPFFITTVGMIATMLFRTFIH